MVLFEITTQAMIWTGLYLMIFLYFALNFWIYIWDLTLVLSVTEGNDNNVTLKLMESSKRHEMSQLEKRSLRDQLIFDSKKDITMIECEVRSKEFGQSGAQWLAPIIKNAKDLCYINLSNSYLNDASVQIICESIQPNKNNRPLKLIYRISTQFV